MNPPTHPSAINLQLCPVMTVDFSFLFLKEQIKDIIIIMSAR
jgi:hypothetical protein